MKARPILFSTPMVLALLAGRKTQTRRIVKPQPRLRINIEGRMPSLCPHGRPDDLLWVRETWQSTRWGNGDPTKNAVYRAGGRDQEGRMWPSVSEWRPSIFMPRWASRITLRITDVRIERVQQISEDDSLDEGIHQFPTLPGGGHLYGYSPDGTPGPMVGASAAEGFSLLWKSINGKDSWKRNPWVWVIDFIVLRENVDAVLRGSA